MVVTTLLHAASGYFSGGCTSLAESSATAHSLW